MAALVTCHFEDAENYMDDWKVSAGDTVTASEAYSQYGLPMEPADLLKISNILG